MTKQEKTRATKEVKRIYNIFLRVVKSNEIAYTCSLFEINELMLNSENEKLEFWRYANDRLHFLYGRK